MSLLISLKITAAIEYASLLIVNASLVTTLGNLTLVIDGLMVQLL